MKSKHYSSDEYYVNSINKLLKFQHLLSLWWDGNTSSQLGPPAVSGPTSGFILVRMRDDALVTRPGSYWLQISTFYNTIISSLFSTRSPFLSSSSSFIFFFFFIRSFIFSSFSFFSSIFLYLVESGMNFGNRKVFSSSRRFSSWTDDLLVSLPLRFVILSRLTLEQDSRLYVSDCMVSTVLLMSLFLCEKLRMMVIKCKV